MALKDVIEETKLDLSNPQLMQDVLAPMLAERLVAVIPEFKEARQAVAAMMKVYSSMAAATTVAGALGAAVAAVGAAKQLLEGQVDAKYTENVKRSQATREAFVKGYAGWGSWWSTAISAGGPSSGDLDIKNEAGGWSEADFLAQYNKHFVWMLEKTGRNVIVPTWPTPPYDSPASTPGDWGNGFSYPGPSPLSGFNFRYESDIKPEHPGYFSKGIRKEHLYVQPPLPAIPEGDRDKYWGNAPGDGTLFENKYDTVIFSDGYGIPQWYYYLFSWGTYPYLNWWTSSNQMPQGAAKYAHSAAAAALAAAIHAPTTIHARVESSDVEKCYRQWLLVTGLRLLPLRPKKQVDMGMYLDENGLPWCPSEYGLLPVFDPKCKSGNKYDGKCPPPAYYPVPWRVARDIELSFRSFFTVRRAAIFQIDKTSDAFKDAAKKSRDAALRKAVASGPPAYKKWDPADPLGDGWRGSPKDPPKREGRPDAPPKREGRPDAPPKREGRPDAPKVSRELIAILAGGGVVVAALGWRERERLIQLVQRIRGKQ